MLICLCDGRIREANTTARKKQRARSATGLRVATRGPSPICLTQVLGAVTLGPDLYLYQQVCYLMCLLLPPGIPGTGFACPNNSVEKVS